MVKTKRLQPGEKSPLPDIAFYETKKADPSRGHIREGFHWTEEEYDQVYKLVLESMQEMTAEWKELVRRMDEESELATVEKREPQHAALPNDMCDLFQTEGRHGVAPAAKERIANCLFEKRPELFDRIPHKPFHAWKYHVLRGLITTVKTRNNERAASKTEQEPAPGSFLPATGRGRLTKVPLFGMVVILAKSVRLGRYWRFIPPALIRPFGTLALCDDEREKLQRTSPGDVSFAEFTSLLTEYGALVDGECIFYDQDDYPIKNDRDFHAACQKGWNDKLWELPFNIK